MLRTDCRCSALAQPSIKHSQVAGLQGSLHYMLNRDVAIGLLEVERME